MIGNNSARYYSADRKWHVLWWHAYKDKEVEDEHEVLDATEAVPLHG